MSEDTTDPAEVDDVTTGLELSLQELIYAGLDALRAARPAIDLVAYLHSSGDNGPQLFLAAPTMKSLRPNEAFELFLALRDAMGSASSNGSDAPDEAASQLGGFYALAVVTGGSASRGLHAVGRRGEVVSADDRAVLVPLAKALGNVAHRLEEVSRDLAT